MGEANVNNMQIREGNADSIQTTVNIPSLATLKARSSLDVVEEQSGQQQPVPEEKCTQENVYNALRDAEPFPSAQQRLDFGQLLDVSARNEARRDSPNAIASATRFVDLARSCFRELHRKSHFSVSLFEVVAVLHTRLTALAALLKDGVAADGGVPLREGTDDGCGVGGRPLGSPRGLGSTRKNVAIPLNSAGARTRRGAAGTPGPTRRSTRIPLNPTGAQGQVGREPRGSTPRSTSVPLNSAGARGRHGGRSPPPPASVADPSTSVEGEEEGDVADLMSSVLAYIAFSARVLAAALGSTTGEVPLLPPFSGELCQPRRGDEGIRAEATILAYSKVGVFLSDTLCFGMWGLSGCVSDRAKAIVGGVPFRAYVGPELLARVFFLGGGVGFAIRTGR